MLGIHMFIIISPSTNYWINSHNEIILCPCYLYNVKFKLKFSAGISFDLYKDNYNILAVLTGHSRMRSHDFE